MSEQDYLAFADRIAHALQSTTLHPDGKIGLNLDLNAALLQAERHARLLARIAAWANSDPKGHPMRMENHEGCKVYIRSLLAQTGEDQ